MGIARVSRQATKNPTITIKWGEVWCGPKQILMPFEVPCKLYVKADSTVPLMSYGTNFCHFAIHAWIQSQLK